ncbi:MAG: ribosome maturation factor RimM [Niabella sp.]
MSNEHYISIGKFAGTHGLKGELVLKHGLGAKEALKGLKTFFIKDKSGHYLPWFIEAARLKNDKEVYIKAEEVNSIEAARNLLQKEVWLSRKDFDQYADSSTPVGLLGYKVIDNTNELGIIEEVIEQPHQILCRLQIQQKDVYIPLHEESLQKIDRKRKKIWVTLPEGLLDVYLK